MGAFTPECVEKILPSLGAILPLEKRIKQFQKIKPQKIILIAGPTACGKTALSLLVAQMLGGEIVSADSCQVYKGMDIGTAKVSSEEQGDIPHHLIDIRNIQESFNVVDFYYEARQCCESILARGKVPIVVGGSGFYFRALIYGPPSGPPPLPDVRDALEKEMELLGPEALYERLKGCDATYAATITPNDRQKVIRGLEIVTLTGEPVSRHEWKHRQPLPDFDYHSWFIYRPREVLYPAIEKRCEQMLERGLIDEVKELEKRGLRLNLTAAQAIGYRQCLDFLDSHQKEEDYKHFVQAFKTASRRYAKRQFTWFRKEPIFHWLNVDVHDLEIAAEMIVREYHSHL